MNGTREDGRSDAPISEVLVRGMWAGFLATAVLSALTLILDTVPRLDVVTLLDGVSQSILNTNWWPPAHLTGWLAHFLIGTIWWGGVFGLLEPILPGQRYWSKGLTFGIGCGLLVMLMVMPMAGAGYFGMHLSLLAPLVTLILHAIYGMVLGLTFGRLTARSAELAVP